MKKYFSLLLTIAFAAPAFASVTVSSPSNGDTVGTPFPLSANSSSCSSQPVSAMGYSIDNSTNTTIVHDSYLNTKVNSNTGYHTVHVKAWGNHGAVCVTDVAIHVTTTVTSSSTSSSSPWIPSNAISVSGIQTLSNWKAVNDTGTGGGYASGSMSIVGSPSMSGGTRAFYTKFSNSGGARYHASFGDNSTSQNFLYDAWVYLNNSATSIANIEMDMNQVMPNGQTVIFGFQCDGYSNTWDYTANTGSPSRPHDSWIHSKAYCNPRDWSRYAWHHVQIRYSRDNYGKVTYYTVWLDGLRRDINATVPSAFALGWGKVLLTNFQIDGLGSGSNSVYLSDLKVYRW